MVRRRAHTLLELIASSTLISIALTTTLALMRDSVDLSMETEQRNMTTTLCVSKLEERLARIPAAGSDWTAVRGTVNGNFSADGFPEIRFTAVHSDSAADGGIPDRLMVIKVTVWDDKNGDGAISNGEAVVRLASKVAKLTLWEVP